jgi:hypothetical protein
MLTRSISNSGHNKLCLRGNVLSLGPVQTYQAELTYYLQIALHLYNVA